MSNSVQIYLLEVDRNRDEASKSVEETAQKIRKSEMTLVDVVKLSQEYLTDDDATVVAKAIGFLAETLESIVEADKEFLTARQGRFQPMLIELELVVNSK
jgi:NADH:ubiquinone oxidoreductase subunit E